MKKVRISVEASGELLQELLAASQALKATKRKGVPSLCPHINALAVRVSQELQKLTASSNITSE